MTHAQPEWASTYPDRWHLELQALHATGWEFRVVDREDQVVLQVGWPPPGWPPPGRPAAGDARLEPAEDEDVPLVVLEVWFPAEYPFFPPQVYDHGNRLQLRRHRNAADALCLIERADWHPDTTVADLLARQLPRLVEAGRSTVPPAAGLEVRTPEPVEILFRHLHGQQPVIMPATPIPSGCEEGALVVRYTVRPGGILGAGLVERILGEGLDLPGPARALEPLFHLVTFGRWTRDPDFSPADSPAQTWDRLQNRLQPLHADLTESPDAEQGHRPSLEVPPEEIETLCLLVPSERGYRQPGEAWVAFLRIADDDSAATYHQLPVQQVGPETYATRTPQSRLLAARRVALIGTGALGSHIAEDLVRTGIGHLDLVDGDEVDVGTATRQYAPLYAAGRPKVETLVGHLRVVRPDTRLTGLDLHIGQPVPGDRWRKRRATLIHVLRTADLVIDATAAPTVTRYLAAVRHAHGLPFLHISATAGAWGGCVFLATSDTGCWACLQHHRLDRSVPYPTADPADTITLAGCADPTFTGTSPDLATIAHHASRVAIEHLLGRDGLGSGLYVAQLRSPDGTPQPVTWQQVPVPVHPHCQVHAAAENPPSCVATAPDARTRTMTEQPLEREADGHSPPRAPIPATQQRKHHTASPEPRHSKPAPKAAGDTTRPRRR